MELPQKKRKVDGETNLPRQRRRIVSERTEVGVEGDFPGTVTLGRLFFLSFMGCLPTPIGDIYRKVTIGGPVGPTEPCLQ